MLLLYGWLFRFKYKPGEIAVSLHHEGWDVASLTKWVIKSIELIYKDIRHTCNRIKQAQKCAKEQGVIFPAGVRVFPTGNLQTPRNIDQNLNN